MASKNKSLVIDNTYHLDKSSFKRNKLSMYSSNYSKKFRGLEMIHSSFTIDKGKHSISFGKQRRFKPKFEDKQYKFNSNKSLLNDRSSFIGYGKKQAFPSYVLKRAKQYPSPQKYFLRYNFLDLEKKSIEPSLGKSFLRAERKQPNLYNPANIKKNIFDQK